MVKGVLLFWLRTLLRQRRGERQGIGNDGACLAGAAKIWIKSRGKDVLAALAARR